MENPNTAVPNLHFISTLDRHIPEIWTSKGVFWDTAGRCFSWRGTSQCLSRKKRDPRAAAFWASQMATSTQTADAERAGEGGGVRGCGVSGSWKQQRCSQQRRERRRRRDPKRRRAVGVGVRRLYSKRGVGVGLSPRGCSSPVPVAQVTR